MINKGELIFWKWKKNKSRRRMLIADDVVTTDTGDLKVTLIHAPRKVKDRYKGRKLLKRLHDTAK